MSRFQPALLGGLFIGVMSALPGIQAGNCCCCLWVLSGGVLTTYLLQGRQAAPVETSEVLVQGLIAGAVGGILSGIISLALHPIIGPWQQQFAAQMMERFQSALPPESRQQFDEAMRQQGAASTAAEMVRSLMFVPISAAFGTAGAALGIAFFRKKAPNPVA